MLYSMHKDPKCERFNCILYDLLRTPFKEQKQNWILHLSNLVLLSFSYNAMPNSTTRFQPFELIIGHKARTVSHAWLGLANVTSEKWLTKFIQT